MFFPEKITGIKPNHKVLDVGPGGLPFARADVFLERKFGDESEARQQRGGADLAAQTQVVYYDGTRFPFDDNEFDYVVCSHVVEHVADLEPFLAELSRVAPRGYIEYPTIYYEYLYNFAVHVNLLKFKQGTLYYLPKHETNLDQFFHVQRFFARSLDMGHVHLVNSFKNVMFEGFEWTTCVSAKRANDLNGLVFDEYDVPRYKEAQSLRSTVLARIKQLFTKSPR